MESASAKSAAATKPKSLSPFLPMAQFLPDQSPVAMTPAELEAAIAALPAKKDALRETFGRLAACSPFPLAFTWDDLDAHISSIQSSISLRRRQLRVLEVARPTPVPTGDDEMRTHQGDGETSKEEDEAEEDNEDVVEEVLVEEEEEVEEEVEVEEEEEEAEVEEEEEEVEVEEEVEEEEVDANNVANKEHNSDQEMLELEGDAVKEHKDLVATDEADDKEHKVELEEEVEKELEEEEEVHDNNVANMEHNSDEEMMELEEDEVKEHKNLVATDEADDKEQKVHKVENGEEEPNGEMEKEEEAGEANKVLSKGVEKYLIKACATMNTQSLVNILFNSNFARQDQCCPMSAVRHAKDAAAFILDVVTRLLRTKKMKTNKVWENCVALIRCVPLVEPEISVHTMEQAKQLAKDWKKVIGNGGSCGDLGYLASWAFLYFLISYNIVSDFDAGEIIRLFATVPRKYQRKSCIDLCNGLGLVSRITDLIDYLIENGQELNAILLIQVLKLVEKYPPLSLLERYIERAKRTALELISKNVIDKSLKLAKTKEIENLRLAHTMIKKQRADSSRSITILKEINSLLDEYTKIHILIKASTALSLNSRLQQKEEQKYQKRKKEQQQHEGQDRQVKGKQRKLAGSQEQPQEKGQQLPLCKPHESRDQQKHENKGNEQSEKQKQQQQQIETQHHLNQPRPCVTKLATPVGPSPRFVPPAVLNVAQISPIGHQPFAVMHGALQPRFPGIQGGPLGANGVPPQYNPFH